jgi:hypothetical protein
MHSFRPQPIIHGSFAGKTYYDADENAASRFIAESQSQYRPRHPERSAFYQLFETHFDGYVRAYEERFDPRSGPLRPVVARSVEEFLACGRLEGGFARIRCDKCRKEHLLAFSCRTRNFCSSCQAKRSILFAEKLTGEILAPVPHRHWTFSIPRVLRGLFERERSLLGLLSQTAYSSILKIFQGLLGRADVRPGCVFSLQTFGAYGANFNPHCHGIVTDGAFGKAGAARPRTHSSRDRHPALQRKFSNNSEAAADVRMLIGMSGRPMCVSTTAKSPADRPKNRPGRNWVETRSTECSLFPVRFLPSLFFAPLCPVSLLIPPGFLLPLKIEILINNEAPPGNQALT